ncbi:MAG: hypothetical protein ABSG53_27670 [Thermoguttaceae bacterium]|jgi:hypothetical protein
MGQIRFIVSPPQRITEEVLQFTYMSGMDRTPWVVYVEADDGELVLERDVSDSGSVTVPWHVEGHGLMALSTATLIERWEPYHLPVELARGTINLLRAQIHEWEAIGLTVPGEVYRLLKGALSKFSWAVVEQDNGDGATAQEALRIALDGSRLLAAAYADQAIAARRRATGRLPALLGGTLGNSEMDDATAQSFLAAFNMAMVPIYWRDVEAMEGSFDWSVCDRQVQWCQEQGLRICLGPLLQPDARGLPDWVYLWDDDFESLLSAAGDFIDAAVNRYRGKVDLWQCAARVNTSQVLRFSEEEKLRMVAWIICRVKQLDPDHPPMIGIDQPWGEYQGRRAVDLSPIHFADALVRARLDLKAIFLEMNFGCFTGGTLLRSEMDVNRLLDYWSLLGLPLLVGMSLPSADGVDPQARRKINFAADSWDLAAQQAWVARYVPLILAKPGVQAVVWNQFEDSQPHEFPHGGLLTPQGQAKPALDTLAALRAAYFNMRPVQP